MPVVAPVVAPFEPVQPVVARPDATKVSQTLLFQRATWESLEALSRELECSVDYLVNVAAQQYLRNRVPTRPEPVSADAVRAEVARAEAARAEATRAETEAARAERERVERERGGEAPGRPLAVTVAGQRWLVTRRLFVIGRSAQWADLALKDGNVSRKHAQLEWADGAWFLVDLGSTNGVEFNGQRVARHRIEEGDVASICDHQLRFSFEIVGAGRPQIG